MKRRFRWLAVLGVLVALVVGVGALTAGQAAADGGAVPGPMQRFLAKLAGNLGIGEEQLREAVQTTRLQLLDEDVAAGRVRPEQAERARQRIEQGPGFGFGPAFGGPGPLGERAPRRMQPGPGFGFGPAFGGPGHHGESQRGPQSGFAPQQAGFEGVGRLLGLTPTQLRDELRGKSLAELGQARGKSRDEVGQAYAQGVSDVLDRAVAGGRLARERADRILERVRQTLDRVLDRAWPDPVLQRATRPGLEGAAQLLGLTMSQLRDELRGKSLAEVGQAGGKSREQVGQAYLQGVRDGFNRAVANGRLAREQADRIVERVQQNLNSILDQKRPEPRRP